MKVNTIAAAALGASLGLVTFVARADRPPTAAPTPATPASAVQRDAARTLERLCDARPGFLGPMFAGLELGQALDRRVALPSPGLGVTIQLLTTGRRLDGVVVTAPYDRGWAGCYQFADQLHRRWGPPSEGGATEVWHDATREHVATFTDNFGDCTLWFSRTVSAEEWLGDSRSSRIPIWAIGHPVTELAAALGVPVGNNPDELEWSDRSLGTFSDVALAAHVRGGRVIGITVRPPFGSAVADLLWQRLKASYGKPTFVDGHEDTIDVRWRRVPAITVGKYWGANAMPPRIPRSNGSVAPPPRRRATADDGVLVDLRFGD